MGPAEKIFMELLKVRVPIELVMVAGRNQELKERLGKISVPERHHVKVLGFTDKIDELMRVADIVVSKPGGLTASEALACGAAMAVINPLPGFEMQNSDFLLENHAAIKIQQIETISHKITQLLNDPEKLAVLKRNAGDLGDTHAAFRMAKIVMKHIRKKRDRKKEKELATIKDKDGKQHVSAL